MSENNLYPRVPKKDLDMFHYHEALERIYIIDNMVDEFLLKHAVFQKHPELNKKINSISLELGKLYQVIGNLQHISEEENKVPNNQEIIN